MIACLALTATLDLAGVASMAVLIGAVALAVFLLARRGPGGPLDGGD
jgi:hypothetical protein